MNREIKFEYVFESVNGIVKKRYYLHEIPFIVEKCDVWNDLPIVSVNMFTGILDKNKQEIYDNYKVTDGELVYVIEYNVQNAGFYLSPISNDILDVISYQKLGNGYYSRKDLEIIN